MKSILQFFLVGGYFKFVRLKFPVNNVLKNWRAKLHSWTGTGFLQGDAKARTTTRSKYLLSVVDRSFPTRKTHATRSLSLIHSVKKHLISINEDT